MTPKSMDPINRFLLNFGGVLERFFGLPAQGHDALFTPGKVVPHDVLSGIAVEMNGKVLNPDAVADTFTQAPKPSDAPLTIVEQQIVQNLHLPPDISPSWFRKNF